MAEETTYIPGTCNIGKEEIARRKLIMWMSLLVSLLFAVSGWWFQLSTALKALLFFPLATFILCAQQTYRAFCVAFGLKGLFNFETIGNLHVTRNREYIKKDRAMAWQIIITSLVAALALTVLYMFV